MSQERSNKPCASSAADVPILRNRYFTGKYMTARDFSDEQHYMLSRQRLHNRLFHGWGIVCGLKVEQHPNQECRPRWVVVKAGVAIDCQGREVFLHQDTAVEVPLDMLPAPALPANDRSADTQRARETRNVRSERSEERRPGGRDERREQRAPGHEHGRSRGEHDRDSEKDHERPHDHHSGHDHRHDHDHPGSPEPAPPSPPPNGLLLCVRYQEEEVEHAPALYAEGNCDPAHLEANRIREVAVLEFRRSSELPGCWRVPAGAAKAPCRDDCDESVPGPGGSCLEADCPCGALVPLALLVPLGESDGVPRFEIDLHGRRQIITRLHLTQIVSTNWPHGGRLSLQALREEMGGELRIRFNRKLQHADGMGVGINPRTFTVQFGGITRHLEFLPFREHRQPYLDDDGCTAVYPIELSYLRETQWGHENIADSFIYVTLRCDFIPDCHGVPVDGNHLNGRLPSGDGRPGGEFVSWFHVVHSGGSEENE